MADRRVIAFKRLPARMPLVLTAVWWLLLDRLQAPGWFWGATGVVLAFLWLGFFLLTLQETAADPFEEKSS